MRDGLRRGFGVALLIAAVLIVADQPYPNICGPCERGEISYWLCILAGCW